MEARTPIEQAAVRRSPDEQRGFEREQVAAHYEHDPEIFSLVLDSQLAYSTGIYLNDDDDLETAQTRKFAHFRNLLQIKPGEKVLDVGCGWGSVMLNLAAQTEGVFHGITLSARQREVLLERAKARGVADRITVDLKHIEDLDLGSESVDAVIFCGSIVHMHNREAIHRRVGNILRPGGRLLISDCYFPTETRGPRDSNATDYILSKAMGYCRLMSLPEELELLGQAGLDVRLVEDMTASYVRTVADWIDNIRRNRARIEALAPGFARLLQCYMTVGRTSFARRTALEYMILAAKGHSGSNPQHWAVPDAL